MINIIILFLVLCFFISQFIYIHKMYFNVCKIHIIENIIIDEMRYLAKIQRDRNSLEIDELSEKIEIIQNDVNAITKLTKEMYQKNENR